MAQRHIPIKLEMDVRTQFHTDDLFRLYLYLLLALGLQLLAVSLNHNLLKLKQKLVINEVHT
jgi:hypothetical protein